MVSKTQNPFTRLYKATGYSLAGFAAAYRHEQAFRQEVMVLVIVVPVGLWLGNSALEYVLLIGSWLLVMLMELINSAIEAVVDRISDEHHELAGRAKDIGSAAVLLAIIMALMTWGFILLSPSP
ncbi:MAG: diacylglycerol kinase [Gammaproteobacteria bacterium]|nr:MAG: diacylglycerol kinase [Gammaproteobacteria bacterium]